MKPNDARQNQPAAQRRLDLALSGAGDLVPTFDALRSNALVEHLAGTPLTPENGETVVLKALRNGFDATWNIKFPQRPRTVETKDGFVHEVQEWTTWTAKRPFANSEECADYPEVVSAYLETQNRIAIRRNDALLDAVAGIFPSSCRGRTSPATGACSLRRTSCGNISSPASSAPSPPATPRG